MSAYLSHIWRRNASKLLLATAILLGFSSLNPALALPISFAKPGDVARMHCRMMLHAAADKPVFSPDIFDGITGKPGYTMRLGDKQAFALWQAVKGEPDFGFLLGDRWRVLTREQRADFNGAMRRLLTHRYGLLKARPSNYLQACEMDTKVTLLNEDALEHPNDTTRREMTATSTTSLPLGQVEIRYGLSHPAGFEWEIANLEINGEDLQKRYGVPLRQYMQFRGWEPMMTQLEVMADEAAGKPSEQP